MRYVNRRRAGSSVVAKAVFGGICIHCKSSIRMKFYLVIMLLISLTEASSRGDLNSVYHGVILNKIDLMSTIRAGVGMLFILMIYSPKCWYLPLIIPKTAGFVNIQCSDNRIKFYRSDNREEVIVVLCC